MAAQHASVPSPTRTSMVGWLELFYDLVFVAAILVLSSAVSHLHDVAKIVLVVAVFTSLWWIWLSTTLFEDRHRTDDQPQRLLVLSQMFLVAVVAMEANAGVVRDAQYLSVAYALLLLSVAAMYGRVPRADPHRAAAVRHATIGVVVGAVFLVAAFVPDPWCFAVWGVGALVAVAATLGTPAEHAARAVDEHHLVERFGAFTIIVCGEAFVKVAIAVSDVPVDQVDLLALAFQFLLTFAIWTSYFEDVPHAGIAPGRLAPWMAAHLALQLAIAGTAIGVAKLVDNGPLADLPDANVLVITSTLASVFAALAAIGPCTRRRPARPLLVLRAGAAVTVLVVGSVCWLVPHVDVAEGVAALSIVAAVYAVLATRVVGRTSVPPTTSRVTRRAQPPRS